MNRGARVALVFGSFFFCSSAAYSQTASAVSQLLSSTSAIQPITCRATLGPIRGIVLHGSPAPYSAVREFSNVQTLIDGTRISPKPSSEKIFRDSQDRSRTERPFCSGPVDDPNAVIITILNPVSGYAYILDSQNHVAHRYAIQFTMTSQPDLSTQASTRTMEEILASHRSNDGRTSVTENLSPQTMEGVYVTGKRTTETIPAGLEDNDRPITVVEEEWFSPDLNVPILTKDSDPRTGEMTKRLTKIDRSEPSPSLFLPPPDFNIVDETDRITLTYTRH